MVDVMKVMRRPGVWEYFAECEACDGTGSVETDVPVIDFMTGGYLIMGKGDCDECQGDGYRDLTDDEYEAAVFRGEIPACVH